MKFFRISVVPMIGAALALGACDAAAPVHRPDPARGHALYDAHCASCHGADLTGQPDWRRRKADGRLPAPPHDASGHTWHHPMDMLFAMTRNGLVPPLAPAGYQTDMPAFAGTLSDDEIRDVLAYIESTWPESIRAERAKRFGASGR
ncbi:cytochrome c [Nitrogeniibacter mangrovi]|uniref:Cytochrome c n=1 Tax=Nitrogeniibacter mangrovi TaxID=2016596 RepID=A0A6C1AZQ1_9RHOO|nr:cytochrome c [Nitrogeniibacter mangrovi]QID16832.1 cytochrome c [Nitrogeniibacter mangrovi]